ncbi:MAG: tRNA (cytidine(34)-2'-O)-methyltransferase [Deltaproteobacteria bacterium]|nr:tRNA (cytidine(34)-2'-O)-methyltransferase [Deltaproteobacteria bacterium]
MPASPPSSPLTGPRTGALSGTGIDEGGRLRVPPLEPPFHIVLLEPEIPPNTGNVARICAATSSPLHLVGPLGFRIDAHSVRRAGLDYWHLVDLRRHLDWAHFLHEFSRESRERGGASRVWLFTAKTERSWFGVAPSPGDALVFGKESVGLPEDLVAAHAETTVAIPTSGGVRSHNLANAVAIAVYEGLRKVGGLG